MTKSSPGPSNTVPPKTCGVRSPCRSQSFCSISSPTQFLAGSVKNGGKAFGVSGVDAAAGLGADDEVARLSIAGEFGSLLSDSRDSGVDRAGSSPRGFAVATFSCVSIVSVSSDSAGAAPEPFVDAKSAGSSSNDSAFASGSSSCVGGIGVLKACCGDAFVVPDRVRQFVRYKPILTVIGPISNIASNINHNFAGLIPVLSSTLVGFANRGFPVIGGGSEGRVGSLPFVPPRTGLRKRVDRVTTDEESVPDFGAVVPGIELRNATLIFRATSRCNVGHFGSPNRLTYSSHSGR